MKKNWLIVIVIFVVVCGCKCSQEPSPQYIEQAKSAAREYGVAAKLADNEDPAGYFKLLEMAKNDKNTYPTDISEVAEEKIFLLLYSNTDLWIKTFSKVDLSDFKKFVKGIEVSKSARPKDISNEQFKERIFANLGKIKGDKKEMELIDYILGLYNRKRP